MYKFKFPIFVLLSLLSYASCQSGPILTIPQGTLEGKYSESRDGKQYYEFKGVPYGQFSRRFEVSTFGLDFTLMKTMRVSSLMGLK